MRNQDKIIFTGRSKTLLCHYHYLDGAEALYEKAGVEKMICFSEFLQVNNSKSNIVKLGV